MRVCARVLCVSVCEQPKKAKSICLLETNQRVSQYIISLTVKVRAGSNQVKMRMCQLSVLLWDYSFFFLLTTDEPR